MKRERTALAALGGLALIVAGCASAQMVTGPGAPDTAFAPVNEEERPGVVRYLNQGADYVKRRRREDAYRKMHDSCGGAYRIDSEGPRIEGGVVLVDEDLLVAAPTQYWYIQFTCERPGA